MESSISPTLDTRSTKKDGTHPIKLYIYHNGDSRKAGVPGASSKKQDWNEEEGLVITSMKGKGRVNSKIVRAVDKANKVLDRLRLEERLEELSVQQLKVEIDKFVKCNETEYLYGMFTPETERSARKFKKGLITVKAYQEYLIKFYLDVGKDDYSHNFRSEINPFLRFLETPTCKKEIVRGSDAYLHEIKANTLELYKGWLNKCGLKGYTPYNYFKLLAALFKNAQDNGLLDVQDNPFTHFKKRPSKPRGKNNRGRASREKKHRNRYFDQWRSIELKVESPLWHFRNYALFSWNTRGMNFLDICLLTKDQVNWEFDEFYYIRHKLQHNEYPKELTVRLTPEAKAILKYYHDRSKSELGRIFPIIPDKYQEEKDKRAFKTHYEYRLSKLNNGLKSMCLLADLPEMITFYDIRRIHGEHLNEMNIDPVVRKDSFGHHSFDTTEEYSGTTPVEELHKVNLAAVQGTITLDPENPQVSVSSKRKEAHRPVSKPLHAPALDPIIINTPKPESGNGVEQESSDILKTTCVAKIEGTESEMTLDEFIISQLPDLLDEAGKVARLALISKIIRFTDCRDSKLISTAVDQFLAA